MQSDLDPLSSLLATLGLSLAQLSRSTGISQERLRHIYAQGAPTPTEKRLLTAALRAATIARSNHVGSGSHNHQGNVTLTVNIVHIYLSGSEPDDRTRTSGTGAGGVGRYRLSYPNQAERLPHSSFTRPN